MVLEKIILQITNSYRVSKISNPYNYICSINKRGKL
jgi:hypothetical protein